MRGEFSRVRQQVIDELIASFNWHEAVDSAFYHNLFRDTVPAPRPPEAPAPTALNDDGEVYLPGDLERLVEYRARLGAYEERKASFNDAASDEEVAWAYFQDFILSETTPETALVKVVEGAFDVFEEFGSSELADEYFRAVEAFLDKYSLRYDLRRPCSLHTTLPGVFARLMRDLRQITTQDAVLATLMRDFEDSIRDLKGDQSPRRVKQSIAAQFNLLEALLKQHPDVMGAANPANTFGAMCNQTVVWPHQAVKEAAKSIYSFASDYPGIRHGGTPANQLREIDMRDMVSVTIMLAGFTPYFTNLLDPSRAYSD